MPTRYINSLAGAQFLSLIPIDSTSATDTTLALDSAYAYGSAGDAFFTTFMASETGNLTDLWVKVTGYTGTWGSTDGVINVEIREDTNGSNIPGTTLTGSFTIALNGSTGWIKKSGLSIALTAGKQYCIVIGDADGSASNYVTVARHSSSTGRSANLRQIAYSTVAAINGFATSGTNATGQPCLVWKIAGELYSGGGAFSSVSTTSSGTYERGLRFQPPDNCVLAGVSFVGDYGGAGHTFKLYADATAPNGTTLTSFTVPARVGSGTAPQPNSYFFPAANAYNLSAGVWYRFVLDPIAAQTIPRKTVISGSPDADVLAASQAFGGKCYWTQESGSTWADETDAMILMSPILLLNTDAGGGGLLINPGMSGGMR